MTKLTGINTHVATAPGFVDAIIAEGEIVPAGIPVSTEWMKPVDDHAPAKSATKTTHDPAG